MVRISWVKDPVTVVQGYEARHGKSQLASLLLWATWAVEGLYYLDDLDATIQAGYPNSVSSHHPDVVDIAHVRWATGTAITAIDLCAAVLGRLYCGWTNSKEMDLRDFDPLIKNNSKRIAKVRSALPPSALAWVDNVLADAHYQNFQGARNQFTHAWLNRDLQCGSVSGHASRTAFKITPTNIGIGARDLVYQSKEFSGQHVKAFLGIIDAL